MSFPKNRGGNLFDGSLYAEGFVVSGGGTPQPLVGVMNIGVAHNTNLTTAIAPAAIVARLSRVGLSDTVALIQLEIPFFSEVITGTGQPITFSVPIPAAYQPTQNITSEWHGTESTVGDFIGVLTVATNGNVTLSSNPTGTNWTATNTVSTGGAIVSTWAKY